MSSPIVCEVFTFLQLWCTNVQNEVMTVRDSLQESSQTQAALTAAHLYYMQGHTMEAIARELHTSRSTVSRLLSFARSSGLVDIRIRSPLDEPRIIEDKIRQLHHVTAHVAPVPEVITEPERLERVAATAAKVLDQLVVSNLTIGIAWGSTVAAVSRHLIPKKTHNSVIVQLNGSGNTRTTGLLYASEILQRFAHAYGAQAQQFPVPAFFDDPDTKRAFWKERSTHRVLEIQKDMGLVVFSVGAANSGVPSHVYSAGYLEQRDIADLNRDGVVGDVATVFYRANGSSKGIAMNARATGPDFGALRRVPRRLCVVSGTTKLESLQGALAARLITDLVIDEPAARALVGDPV